MNEQWSVHCRDPEYVSQNLLHLAIFAFSLEFSLFLQVLLSLLSGPNVWDIIISLERPIVSNGSENKTGVQCMIHRRSTAG